MHGFIIVQCTMLCQLRQVLLLEVLSLLHNKKDVTTLHVFLTLFLSYMITEVHV